MTPSATRLAASPAPYGRGNLVRMRISFLRVLSARDCPGRILRAFLFDWVAA